MNWGKSEISAQYPDAWLFVMGALFVVVVVFLPNGVAGLFGRLTSIKRRVTGHDQEAVRNPAV
ncbi:hypothetical protein D3C84_1254990 [compost metagenome]